MAVFLKIKKSIHMLFVQHWVSIEQNCYDLFFIITCPYSSTAQVLGGLLMFLAMMLTSKSVTNRTWITVLNNRLKSYISHYHKLVTARGPADRALEERARTFGWISATSHT
jgi:hypothetical protein